MSEPSKPTSVRSRMENFGVPAVPRAVIPPSSGDLLVNQMPYQIRRFYAQTGVPLGSIESVEFIRRDDNPKQADVIVYFYDTDGSDTWEWVKDPTDPTNSYSIWMKTSAVAE